jgi:hypothetical protein
MQCVARGGWVSERQHLCDHKAVVANSRAFHVQCWLQHSNAVECSKVNEMVAVVALANRCNLSDHHKPERATKLMPVKWPSFEVTRRLQVCVPLQEWRVLVFMSCRRVHAVKGPLTHLKPSRDGAGMAHFA